jgi:phospholipid transport system substrate-binding protein
MKQKTVFKKFGLLAGTAVVLGFSAQASAACLACNLLAFEPPQTESRLLVTVSDAKFSDGAKSFVQSVTDRGIGFLGSSDLSHDQRKAEFSKLLSDSFDMKTIARFSLGRYWKSASKDQQKEYLNLFEKMIIEVYSQRFSDYQGEKIEVNQVRQETERDVLVTTFIVPASGPEIQVDWRVRYKNGDYKIVDIVVEGVSMALTQRADFASVIQRGGGQMDVLLAHLRKK